MARWKQQPSDAERRAELEVDTLRFISNRDEWIYGVCPLTRYVTDTKGNKTKQTGYMLSNSVPAVVYLGNIFMINVGDPVIGYNTLGAIVNDGWLVD